MSWTRFFSRRYWDEERARELDAYIEAETDENIARGMSPKEARHAAHRKLGNTTLIREEIYTMNSLGWLETLWQDVRYGLRQMRREPKFTAVAVVTLALGIGATTAIFSIVDAVLLHGVPYREPARLVAIICRSSQSDEDPISAGDFTDWRLPSALVEGPTAYKRFEFRALTGMGEPDEAWVSPVLTNVFHLLGVNPAIGRSFAPDETQTAILSHQYWLTQFAADPKVVGRTVELDDKPYTIIGVAPADFEFPDPHTQMWVPLALTAAEKGDHEDHLLGVVARLQPGISLKQAQAAMDATSHQLAVQYPKTDAGWTALVKPYKGREISRDLRSAILALMAAVVFVLLIVAANVTSLLLARGTTRQAEMAIRAALGAVRWRLIRQLLVEAVLLAGTASLAGVLLTRWSLAAVAGLLPKFNLVETQALHRIAINVPVLLFAAGLSLLTGIAVGLLPALRASGFSLNESLKQRRAAFGAGHRGSTVQRALIVCEVAMALVLLVGAALMIQTFEQLQAAPTGFKPDHLLTVRVPLVRYKYTPGLQSAAFYRTILERVRAIPGVRAAGMANNLPFVGFSTSVDLKLPEESTRPGQAIYIATRSVSPGYFRAMGVQLKEGRDFAPSDDQKGAPCVRIVNESLSRLYWRGVDPVGKQLPGSCPKNTPALIVGLVADSKQGSVDKPAAPELFHPYGQFPFASFLVTFVVRTSGNPTDVAGAVRRAVREVDHDQPVIQVRTMANVIAESIWRQRLSASMLGIFAAIALVLSVVGIYGVFSYTVALRTHEIGIRVALGASRREILRMVIGEGLLLTATGVGAGVLAALAMTRVLATLLYHVRPAEPLTFVALSLMLAGVGLVATYLPARRATKVDPMVALRYE